ncbi:MAG: hypothetical protein IPL54_08865 [Chitinophagaceae bacterium]|nr:hypothetical protein [Chitinophagaceae bacterium]
MLVIIDGTGEASDSQYAETMKNGFLKQLEKESPIYPKVYFRGPTWSGQECEEIVDRALNWISRNMQNMPQGRVPELYLAGYSRGGTIAIAIAQKIQKLADNPDEQLRYDRGTYMISPDNTSKFQAELYNSYARSWFSLNRNIKCLALFDAVDRALSLNTDVIPRNVKMVYHALRSPTAGSRRSFANTGIAHESGSSYYNERHFLCSHAAMGGVPWTGDRPTEFTPVVKTFVRVVNTFSLVDTTTVIDIVRDEGIGYGPVKWISKPLLTEQQDKIGSRHVHEWMWENMRKHGMI